MSIESRHDPWLRLLLVPELRKPHWFRLHKALGSPEAILGSSAKQISRIADLGDDAARAVLSGPNRDVLEREKQLIAETGADICTFDDPDYPENLRQSSAPPMMLYVLGQLQPTDRYAVTVVGSRTMTQYGRLACQKLVAGLAGAGLTIVSGMAYGVDSVAHDSALRNGGRTVAVLAQGLAAREAPYRQEMRRRIAEQGAVLSEFPMAAVPEPYRFPTRNHTMAALGLATVVVEAGEKSGALITAEKALEENRQVFAVPGDITRPTSCGTNNLIREGAILARSADDVLADLKAQLESLLGTNARKDKSESIPTASLSETARAVLGCIGDEPVHLDTLHDELADAGFDIGSLSAALLELEMKGFIRHLPGNLYMTERMP